MCAAAKSGCTRVAVSNASAASSSSRGYKVSFDSGYTLKQVEVDGRLINLQLWDIAGHERFGGMTRVYYKYAHGAILVFDLARPETFDSALKWLADVTEKLFDEQRQKLGPGEQLDLEQQVIGTTSAVQWA